MSSTKVRRYKLSMTSFPSDAAFFPFALLQYKFRVPLDTPTLQGHMFSSLLSRCTKNHGILTSPLAPTPKTFISVATKKPELQDAHAFVAENPPINQGSTGIRTALLGVHPHSTSHCT
ncbi:Hypothetical protein CpMEX30_1249 [Corynebacterium pseudotuberculosis]|nr:Hypothetical protein CpMEX30_1249 [Corynebacterium pseudotuberculosis]APQ56374.1 Hypothetical protein CpMEX31_1247 [Corynebacterium pseudotuberculosis]ATV80536.1 Hypothetical protein BFF97_01807 [Corynebacterium pseudotuberculosis]AUY60648.1 Hypothetical protein BFG00_1261 [Corynebacterium pseudotuberculosis]